MEPLSPSRFTGRRKIALGVGGVGLLAVSAGIVLGVQSKHLDDDTYALCPSLSTPCSAAKEANDLNQRGRSRALEANIAYGVAGGAAIAAAVLWLTGAPESRVAITPQLGTVAGFDAAVRFCLRVLELRRGDRRARHLETGGRDRNKAASYA